MKPTINDALFALGCDGGWKVTKGVISGWTCKTPQPTDEAIQAKLSELQDEYDLKAYSRNRQNHFPNEHDLLVALWEKVVEGRSENADALQAIRTQVKAENPKP